MLRTCTASCSTRIPLGLCALMEEEEEHPSLSSSSKMNYKLSSTCHHFLGPDHNSWHTHKSLAYFQYSANHLLTRNCDESRIHDLNIIEAIAIVPAGTQSQIAPPSIYDLHKHSFFLALDVAAKWKLRSTWSCISQAISSGHLPSLDCFSSIPGLLLLMNMVYLKKCSFIISTFCAVMYSMTGCLSVVFRYMLFLEA